MPKNFIVSFDSGDGKIGTEHCNACLMICTRDEDVLTVLHTYHNEEAIHLYLLIINAGNEINGIPITILEEK